MAVPSRHKIWSTVFIGIAMALVACTVAYFLIRHSGASVRSAASLVAILLGLTLIPVAGFLWETLRDPDRNPLQVSTRAVFWITTCAVVPILASVLSLGIGVLVLAMLLGLEAVGLPVSDLRLVSWLTNGASLLCAVGIWWFISQRYRR